MSEWPEKVKQRRKPNEKQNHIIMAETRFHAELSVELGWVITYARALGGVDTISCQALSSGLMSSLVHSMEWKLWRNGQCVPQCRKREIVNVTF